MGRKMPSTPFDHRAVPGLLGPPLAPSTVPETSNPRVRPSPCGTCQEGVLCCAAFLHLQTSCEDLAYLEHDAPCCCCCFCTWSLQLCSRLQPEKDTSGQRLETLDQGSSHTELYDDSAGSSLHRRVQRLGPAFLQLPGLLQAAFKRGGADEAWRSYLWLPRGQSAHPALHARSRPFSYRKACLSCCRGEHWLRWEAAPTH